MANEQIERIHKKSYHYCKQDAKKWRVNAASQYGLVASNYKVGDSVTVDGLRNDDVITCWKVAPPNPGETIGHGIVIHVDTTMTIVCWKPIEESE